jgi:hypothetical protein
MPKLHVDFDVEFDASPIVARDSKLMYDVRLPAARLRTAVEAADPEDLSVAAVLVERGTHISYIFGFRPVGPKGDGVLTWTFDFRKRTVKVVAKGQFVSKSLKAGVGSHIQRLGTTASFRLWGFHHKDGAWNGFEAPVIGQKENDLKNWIRLPKWKLK